MFFFLLQCEVNHGSKGVFSVKFLSAFEEPSFYVNKIIKTFGLHR